jgi:hypothetical protein
MAAGPPGPGNGFIFRSRTTQDAELLQTEHELNRRFRSAPMSRRARLIGVAVLGGGMVAGVVAKLIADL